MSEQTSSTNSQALQIVVVTSRPLLTKDGDTIDLLDVAEERRRIFEGLKRAGNKASARVVPEATTDVVLAALRADCDVVHFTGHGTQDGQLVLEDGFGIAHFLPKEEAARLFVENTVSLVVLSSCFSETIGRALTAAGVPAVVAIDATTPIADKAAIIFAEHFYDALSRQRTIKEAFDAAKTAVAVHTEVGDAHPPVERLNETDTWSNRFKLLGDGSHSVKPTIAQTHQEPKPFCNLDKLTNFYGRTKEIVEIIESLEKRKLPRVALCGSGGIGKTALSKAVAWWYLERERANAVLWTSAALDQDERYRLRDLSSLLSVVIRSWDLAVTEQSLFEEQKRVVREFLESNRAVVVLDNWETIDTQNRKELWNFIKSLSDDVRVIITSREELPPQSTSNIHLKTLDQENALRLFLNIAVNTEYFKPVVQSIRPWALEYVVGKEEAEHLNNICEHLSGYPLALEVTAGQTCSRSLKDIWEELERYPKNVLESIDEITGEPRGVWTSLDMSYKALSLEEQKLFRQLCVFLAPALYEDMVAVTGTNDRKLLDKLVRRSLVQMIEGMYSLLPVLRLYSESKFHDAGEDIIELHRLAINNYQQKNTLEASLIASEHLFELADRYKIREEAEAFHRYLGSFYQILVTRGLWFEAREKTAQLICVAKILKDKQMGAMALGESGNRYIEIEEYEKATKVFEQSLKIFQELNNRQGIATSLHNIGVIHEHRGEYETALEYYNRSLKIKEELGNSKGVAYSLHNIGIIHQLRGEYEQALDYFNRSLKIKEELDNPSGVANSLHQIGSIHQDRDEYEKALEYYNRSLKIFEELGNPSGIASSHGQIGNLFAQVGRYEEAFGLLMSALSIFLELQSPNARIVAKFLKELRAKWGEDNFDAAWKEATKTDVPDSLTQ